MSDHIWEIPEELKQAHDANVNTEKIAPANEPVFYDGLTPRNDLWAESIYGENNQNLMKPIGTFATPEEYLRNYMAINYREQPSASDYQTFWEDPIKLARYKIAIDNLPPGMEPPSWYNKAAVDKAWAYMSAYNPGRYWEEWTPLDPTHPIRTELRGLSTPPIEAIPDRDWGSLTPQEIWTSYSDGTNSGLTGAMSYLINQGLGGQPLASEAVNTALASYEPGQLSTEITGINGMDEEIYQSLPPWKKMLVWMGSSGVAGSATQAAGIGAGMGLLTNGLGGLVVGGAMGAGLGAGASATQNSMPWLANALNTLDLPAEGLERITGMLTQIGGAAIEDLGEMYIRTNKWGESREYARSEVQEQEDSLTSILNDLPSAWRASALTYEIAGATLTGGKVDTLEQAESIQLDPDQFGLQALKDARAMIQAGASLNDVRTEFANRYGVTGQLYDLAGHVLADPLNLIPAAGLKLGAKVAQKTGNKALQLAFKVSSTQKGWRESDGVIRTLTKTYPALLRLNLEDAAKIPGKFGSWSRHMAGIDLDMNGHPVDHWFTPEGQAEVRKKRLFGLTPEARAEESASNILMHVGLNINDAVTPTEVTQTLTRMASTDPNIAATVGDGSWANSAEASAAPVLMRDVAKSLPELQENLWDIHEPDRTLFNNLAKASGIDTDDSVALNRFMTSMVRDPDNTLAQVKRNLTEAGNTKLLAVLNDPNDPVKGIDLKKRAEMFLDGRAVMTLDEYKARVTAYFLDGVEKELVNWFDIKPDKWIFRFGNMIKNMQSMLLLGVNPTYYMNNVINNVVTQAFSGVLGFDGRKANANFWKRLGVDSPRRLSGVGAADIGMVMQGKSPISAAKQTTGLLGKIDDFARKMNKVLPFTRLSQSAEVGASDVATTVAGKKAWYAIHKAGIGFDKMSKPSEQMLKNWGIDPKAFIYAAIENGMNIDEIQKNLWDEVSYNFLSQVATPDQQRLLQDVGVYDSLSARLQKAKNGADIEQAFNDTADEMYKYVQSKAAIDTVSETAKWYQTYITEGSQAAYRAFDMAITSYADFFSAYQKELDDFHAGLEKVPVGRRRMLKEQFFAKADRDFKIQALQRDKRLVGVCQAMMGNGSPEEIKLTGRLQDASAIHDSFFGSRKRIWNDFFNAYDGDMQSVNEFTDSMRNIIGEERVTELQGKDGWMYRAAQEANRVNYRNMNEALDDIQLDIDNLFIEMFETHYPGGRNAAIAWRAQARYLQQVLVEAEDYFRHGEEGNKLSELGATGASVKKTIDEILGGQSLLDIPNEQRNKYWKQYHQKVKQPLIVDQENASLICQTNITDAAAGKKVVEQPKAKPEKVFSIVEEKVEKAAVKKMEVDLKAKAQADEVRQIVQKPDKYIINMVNKYSGEKVKTINDITPEMARKAMDERTRLKAEEVKVEDVEPVKPKVASLVEGSNEWAVANRFVQEEADRRFAEKNPDYTEPPRISSEVDKVSQFKRTQWEIDRKVIKQNLWESLNNGERPDLEQKIFAEINRVKEVDNRAKAIEDSFSKNDWEVPQNIYVERAGGGIWARRENARKHKEILERALEAGEDVPDEVLKDYPDLQPKQPRNIAGLVEGETTPHTTVQSIDHAPGDEFYSYAQGLPGKNGNKLVAYQHLRTQGEKYSAREEGLVGSKVSDWDRAVPCATCGRKLVHIYWVQDADGVKPYGSEHLHEALGEARPLKDSETKSLRIRLENEQAKLTSRTDSLKARIKDTKSEANYVFNQSNGDIQNSAIYQNAEGKFIRVDTTNQNDVDIVEGLGFEPANVDANRTVAEIENELAYKAANMDAIAKNSHGVYNREAFARDLVDVFKLPQEQADGVMAYLDAMSNYWARRSGKAPERWWTDNIAGLVEGGEGELEQNQNYFYNTILSDAEVNDYALALSRTPNQVVNALSAEMPSERIRLLDALYKIDPNLARKTAMETKGTLWQTVDTAETDLHLINKAKDYFGVDNNWKRDGWIHPDGTILKLLNGGHGQPDIHFGLEGYYAYGRKTNSIRWVYRPDWDEVSIDLHTNNITPEQLGVILNAVDKTNVSIEHIGGKTNTHGGKVIYLKKPTKEELLEALFNPDNKLFQQAKGATSWIEDGRAIMHALEGKDVSTVIHESAHIWLRTLPGVADDDIATVTNWLRTEYKYDLPDNWVTGDVNTFRDAHEAFARAFEKYLQEGKAPKPELQGVFDSFKQWLTEIYRKVRGLEDVKLTDDMRALFDKWLGDEQPLPDGMDYMPKRPVGFDPTALRRSKENPNVLDVDEGYQYIEPKVEPVKVAEPVVEAPVKSEKLNKAGFTKVQEDYIAGAITRHIDEMKAKKVLPAENMVLDKEVGADKANFEPLDITIPDGGTYKITTPDGLARVYYYVTGKKIRGWEGVEYNAKQSSVRLKPTLPDTVTVSGYGQVSQDALAAIRLYGGINEAVEVVLRQTDINNPLVEELSKIKFDKQKQKVVSYAMDKEQSTGTVNSVRMSTLFQEPEPIPPVQSVAGTVDSLAPPPQTSAMIEGVMNEVNPVLNELHMKYLQAEATTPKGKLADRMREGIRKANPELSEVEVDNLLAQGTKEVQKYIRTVEQQMKGEKLATMKLGLAGRDFAILNYNQRTNFDNYMGVVFPYQFWYTRSMLNWAIRGLDRPAMLANYSRLRKLQSDLGREGLPYRLRNKSFIPMPFIPDWMGEGVYFDPLKQVFPFEQFTRPIDNILKQHNTQVKKAMSILHQWETEGEADSEAVTEALQTQSGDLWKRAMAQADIEMEENIENPFDFATSLIGTSLPIQYAYQLAMGRPERISQLPVTRFIQAMTGMANIGGPAGINIEAPIRKAVGLPEMDRYYDYRVNRMLANMAAEGVITAEQASQAIVSKTGPVFEQAQGRVAQMGGWQYLGAPLGVDFFPEGEQIDRALQKEYNNAIEKWKAGDEQALTTFFDKYPEYETQMLAWKDEGEQLKRFLISEVWDKYMALPAVHKKQVQEQFGDNFTMAFLNSDTRDYDALDTETITMWAQMLNGFVPEKKATLPLKLADEATAKAVDAYYAERKAKFGSEITEEVYQSDAYNKWRNAYLAKHPGVIEWITTEQSELYGLPAEVQQQVYQFRAMRDAYYPNIYQTQEEYFALDKETRKKYIEQHPELASYWDFREQMAGQFPKASTYIMSDQAVSNALTDQTPYQLIQITRRMSGQLYRQFMGYLYGNETLTAGAKKELKRLWEEAGEPEGDLDDWLEQAKNSL